MKKLNMSQEDKYFHEQAKKLSGTGQFWFNQGLRWGKTPKQAMAYVTIKTAAILKHSRKNRAPIEKTKNIGNTDGWSQKDFYRGKNR